jgi:hypothetical protein
VYSVLEIIRGLFKSVNFYTSQSRKFSQFLAVFLNLFGFILQQIEQTTNHIFSNKN